MGVVKKSRENVPVPTYWQKTEDSAAAIVDNDDAHWVRCFVQAGEGGEVVECGLGFGGLGV